MALLQQEPHWLTKASKTCDYNGAFFAVVYTQGSPPTEHRHTSARNGTAMRRLASIFPLVDQLRSYGAGDIRSDITAGLTTAVMLIPQAMAYAMLAGLPPIVGLYASTVPLLSYALFGTSRQLAVGPVAVLSLMTAASVGAIAEVGTDAYMTYALVLALMVGVIQLVMGLARLGIVTNFLSHPVLSGFTSAAALIIAFSQFDDLIGPGFHLPTAIIGGVSLLFLLALRIFKPSFPGMFFIVVASIAVAWAMGLENYGVELVGQVPTGLPAFSMVPLEWEMIRTLLPSALVIALVGFMESFAVAKKLAEGHGEADELEPNRELVGLGAANAAGAFFGSFPVTGGFSRSAVNDRAGARSNLAAVLTVIVVVVTLLFLTDLFYYLPQTVLAAIIMTAIVGLIDIKAVKHLWEVKRDGLVILVLTFASTLIIGIEEGLAIGIGASLLWFIIRATKPHVAVLGRLPQTTSYRNLDRHPEAKVIPGLLLVRIDSQFFFGNVSFLKSTLTELEKEMDQPLKAVIIDASSINQLDSSAEIALRQILEDYQERDVELYFAKTKGPVLDVMRASSFYDLMEEKHFTYRVHDAVEAACERCFGVHDPSRLEHPVQ